MLNTDVQIHRIVKLRYGTGYFIEQHKHSFFHYVYILDGKGEYTINGEVYIAEKGDLVLVPPDTMHEIYSIEDLAALNIKFTAHPALMEKLNRLAYHVRKLPLYEENIVMGILNEAVALEEFSEELINIRFTELLFHLLRNNRTYLEKEIDKKRPFGAEMLASGRVPTELAGVLAHMHEHFDQGLNVNELSEMSGYSESYFCTLFKRTFGKAPIQYIHYLKINKSIELMARGDLNVTKIAEMLGFENIHYFSRLFKQKTGVSPYEYMNRMKNDIVINLIRDSAFIPKTRYENMHVLRQTES